MLQGFATSDAVLKVHDLQASKAAQDSDLELVTEEEPEVNFEMELSHVSFSIGSHMDQQKNSSHYVNHYTLSKDGLLFFNMSKIPMKYDKTPLNI